MAPSVVDAHSKVKFREVESARPIGAYRGIPIRAAPIAGENFRLVNIPPLCIELGECSGARLIDLPTGADAKKAEVVRKRRCAVGLTYRKSFRNAVAVAAVDGNLGLGRGEVPPHPKDCPVTAAAAS